ncbi:ArsR family transcriptional regulator [Halobacillus shinanisalinarum]|uniref:ArsR family transcriptional regulator n=1 Tax=Halobacillus shinanisalinarum TaxID=2932258 RepID=A0ABY4H6F4_9BACI|nr:metalloregulator ArsR/SmtB family transcription factor [Halobacillus shinanisalinarum]UOQ95510.1 ArsR family transcriptional regulator [Halobacillus shinanisalinarum]
MEVIQTTSRKRETYRTKVEQSLLYEAALGIAAVTNTPLLDTLEKSDLDAVKKQLSNEMNDQLQYVEENNTWKSLLQLLHQDSFPNLDAFIEFIQQLDVNKLKYICLPYLGLAFQELRDQASKGDKKAVKSLQIEVENHPFFKTYISFITTIDPTQLKNHLIAVITGWYIAVIIPQEQELQAILQRDQKAKQDMSKNIDAESLVEWATGGIKYFPEPSVYRVLLIPQRTYRPWNVEADIEGTKIFYYPVSNDSIYKDDPYAPDQFLVQKYKALGDEVRMKIVKLLFEKERTLHELTDTLNMGKSTIHHHLKLLKSARIVEGERSIYRLKKNSVDMMATELEHFIGSLP